MAEVVINEESLSSLKDNVVIVTGGSSGIGLTTVQLLLSLGAYVIGTDLNSPPEGAIPSSSSSSTSASSSSQFSFRAANIVDWASLVGAFKHAIELHGRVDHVFANAGIGHRTDYVRGIELDDKGDPLEPTGVVIDVNLKGAINTATLAVHYIRKNPRGGSVVMNASSTALQRFRAVDYAVAKHGVIGLVRGLHRTLTLNHIPVRINGVAPSYTGTGMVRASVFAKHGRYTQPPDTVARAAAMLMADKARSGHLVHVDRGVCKEVDEAVLLPAFAEVIRHGDTLDEDETMGCVVGAEGSDRGVGGAGVGVEVEGE